jgi:hypothetical protein
METGYRCAGAHWLRSWPIVCASEQYPGRHATKLKQVAKDAPNAGCPIRRSTMLYTIAVVLLILWLLGLVTSYTIGGFIHILLVIAIVMILLRVIGGGRAL